MNTSNFQNIKEFMELVKLTKHTLDIPAGEAFNLVKGYCDEDNELYTTSDSKINGRQQDNDYVEKLLDLSIATGTLVSIFDESHRGVGKTTALVKKASELGCVLLVDINRNKDYANGIARNLGLNVAICTPKETVLPQFYSEMISNGYIIDEMVNNEILSKLDDVGCKLLGGFKRIVI